MTNRQALIHELEGHIEGKSVDHIACPYYCDEDCRNSNTDYRVGSEEYERNCRHCKEEWLEKEFCKKWF